VRLVSLHTVKPLDETLLQACFSSGTIVATLEEPSILGGLGGAVAEWLSEQGPCAARLLRFGTADHFLHRLEAHGRHVRAQVLRDEEEVGDDVLGRALELGAQLRVLSRDADGASVGVALRKKRDG
jgi:transketolase